MKCNLVIKRFTAKLNEWTPIRATGDCIAWSIRCDTDSLRLRSDPLDPASEDTIAQGIQEYALRSHVSAGDVLIWIASVNSDAQTVIAKFIS